MLNIKHPTENDKQYLKIQKQTQERCAGMKCTIKTLCEFLKSCKGTMETNVKFTRLIKCVSL